MTDPHVMRERFQNLQEACQVWRKQAEEAQAWIEHMGVAVRSLEGKLDRLTVGNLPHNIANVRMAVASMITLMESRKK